VALEMDFLRVVLMLYSANLYWSIAPLLSITLSPTHEVYYKPDEAASCLALSAKLVASSLARHVSGRRVSVV
jgi:hypothetical protein